MIQTYENKELFDEGFINDEDMHFTDKEMDAAVYVIEELLRKGPKTTWQFIKEKAWSILEFGAAVAIE